MKLPWQLRIGLAILITTAMGFLLTGSAIAGMAAMFGYLVGAVHVLSIAEAETKP